MGGLPKIFWVLWVGTIINRLGGFVVSCLSLYLASTLWPERGRVHHDSRGSSRRRAHHDCGCLGKSEPDVRAERVTITAEERFLLTEKNPLVAHVAHEVRCSKRRDTEWGSSHRNANTPVVQLPLLERHGQEERPAKIMAPASNDSVTRPAGPNQPQLYSAVGSQARSRNTASHDSRTMQSSADVRVSSSQSSRHDSKNPS